MLEHLSCRSRFAEGKVDKPCTGSLIPKEIAVPAAAACKEQSTASTSAESKATVNASSATSTAAATESSMTDEEPLNPVPPTGSLTSATVAEPVKPPPSVVLVCNKCGKQGSQAQSEKLLQTLAQARAWIKEAQERRKHGALEGAKTLLKDALASMFAASRCNCN